MVKGKLNIDPILSPVLRENAAVVLRKRGLQHIYLGSLLVNVHVNVLVFTTDTPSLYSNILERIPTEKYNFFYICLIYFTAAVFSLCT